MEKNGECIVAFTPQQGLHERATMLRYTYIADLVCSKRERKVIDKLG